MNCPHSATEWCHDCVQDQQDRIDGLRAAIRVLHANAFTDNSQWVKVPLWAWKEFFVNVEIANNIGFEDTGDPNE